MKKWPAWGWMSGHAICIVAICIVAGTPRHPPVHSQPPPPKSHAHARLPLFLNTLPHPPPRSPPPLLLLPSRLVCRLIPRTPQPRHHHHSRQSHLCAGWARGREAQQVLGQLLLLKGGALPDAAGVLGLQRPCRSRGVTSDRAEHASHVPVPHEQGWDARGERATEPSTGLAGPCYLAHTTEWIDQSGQ